MASPLPFILCISGILKRGTGEINEATSGIISHQSLRCCVTTQYTTTRMVDSVAGL